MNTITNVVVGVVILAASVYIGDKIGTYVIGKHGGALTSTQKVTFVYFNSMEFTASRWENKYTIQIKEALGNNYWIRSANIPTLMNLVNQDKNYNENKPMAPYFSKGTWLLNDEWRVGYGKFLIIGKIVDNDNVFDLTDENSVEIVKKYGLGHYAIKWGQFINDKKCKAIRVRDSASCYLNRLKYNFMHTFDVESLIVIDDSCIDYKAYEISDEDMEKICESDENYVSYVLDLIAIHRESSASHTVLH